MTDRSMSRKQLIHYDTFRLKWNATATYRASERHSIGHMYMRAYIHTGSEQYKLYATCIHSIHTTCRDLLHMLSSL